MENVKKQISPLNKCLTVLCGALLTGFLWRIRGTGGWGSSWGLMTVGFLFTLFIISAAGERKKLSFGYIGLTALSFMLTVPSWGTLLYQITGVLYKEEYWGAQSEVFAYVSPVSAVSLMLCLGFGAAVLFGVMLGRGFSGMPWKIKDFIIVVAVFYLSGIIAKATVAHPLLSLIEPQAADAFRAGLEETGIAFDSVYKIYIQHFDSLAWAKKIDGGRNYFSSIQAVASAIRTVCTLLAVRFFVKDKISARAGLVTSAAFAFSITVSDLFFFFSYGGYHMESTVSLPSSFAAWSLWEYFTGFIAGGIITLFFLSLKDNHSQVRDTAFDFIPQKVRNVFSFALFFLFAVGVNIVRPVIERFKDSKIQIPAIVVSVICAAIFIFLLVKKYGTEDCGEKSAATVLTAMTLYTFSSYMFISQSDLMEIHSISKIHNILVCISVLFVCVYSVIRAEKTKKT